MIHVIYITWIPANYLQMVNSNGKLIASKLALVPLTLETTGLWGPLKEFVYNLQNSSYPILHI